MARRHRMIPTLLTLGAAAAAGWAIYKHRELLLSFVSELSTPACPREEDDYVPDMPAEQPEPQEETHIIIDRTIENAETAENKENPETVENSETAETAENAETAEGTN